MRLETNISVTDGFKKIFDSVDEVLPTGDKTADFFAAFTEDISTFVTYADKLGIDPIDIIGAGIKIEMRILPSSIIEEAAVLMKNGVSANDLINNIKHGFGGGKQ